MRRKKVVRMLALALALCLGMSGCGQTGNNNDNQNNQQNNNAGNEENKNNDEGDSEKVRTISVIGKDYNVSAKPWLSIENYPKSENGKYFDSLLEEMNIELDIETIPNEQYEDAMKMRQSSWLDMPDIVHVVGDKSDWVNYGQSGKTWNIKELLDTYDEDGSIWEYMTENAPSTFSTVFDENGDLWWFPYIYQESADGYPASTYTIEIRVDWLEAIGEEWKPFYTPDELLDIFTKFRENDVNGNGVEDEVLGFNLAGQNEPISSGFGMAKKYIYALSDNSGVQCKLDHENFPAFIEYCQKLYQAGIFSTEILNDGNNIVSGNRASAVQYYNASAGIEGTVAGYEDTARYAAIIIDDDGGANGYTLAQCDNADMAMDGWVVNKDCENPEAIVELMDFIYSDEGSNFMYFGLDGVSSYVAENGVRTWYEGINDSEQDISKITLHNIIGCNILPNACVLKSTKDAWKIQQTTQGYDEKNEFLDVLYKAHAEDKAPYWPSVQPFAMATTEEADAYNAVATTVQTYISELILDLIIGERSLDDLATYRAEVGELGLDKMIEIREAQFERYMNSK